VAYNHPKCVAVSTVLINKIAASDWEQSSLLILHTMGLTDECGPYPPISDYCNQ